MEKCWRFIFKIFMQIDEWINMKRERKDFYGSEFCFSHFILAFWFFSYFFRFFVNNLVESFDMVFLTARLELRWNSTRNHLRYVYFTCELHSWKSNYIVVNVILYGILFRKLHVHTMSCEYSVVEFCEQKLLIRDKNKQFSVIRSDPWLFALYRVQLF